MEIEDSSIYNEVLEITQGTANPVAFYWEADIHLPDEVDYRSPKVLTIDNFRDYEKNIGDEMVVELVIPMGVYAKQIYPNRNILEISLFRTPLTEIDDGSRLQSNVDAERYKAVLVLDGLPNIEGTDLSLMSQDALDLQNILTIRFQLFNHSLEKLRIVTVGGIFRKTTNEDIIRAVLMNESTKVKVKGLPSVDGVDIVTTNNKVKREHVVIPQGTKLIRVPTFIQERCGGVYSSGIGTYLQNRIWYVYPLFDTTKLNQVEKTLTLIKVPSKRYNFIERTYREEAGSVYVLGTSNTRFTDDGSTNFMNDGNGVRLADADKFMDNVATTKDNKSIISRRRLNMEIMSEKKEDKSNNIQISEEGIGSNAFNDYSRLASRFGGIFDFTWDNGDPSLLFPGMRVRVLYLDKENVVELHGVLLAVQTLIQGIGTGMTISRHKTISHLSVFVNKADF